MSNALLQQTKHRPYPLPNRAWILFQRWEHLLFAHWPMPPATIRRLVPDGLTIDTFDGQAWVSVVPFSMHAIHPRYVPPVPWLSSFLELNVRTYVTHDGKPGVWFTSLDAANPLGVWLGRNVYHLPYFNATMRLRDDGNTIQYTSRRTHRGATPGDFVGRYHPTSDPFQAEPGSLDHFLVERYCLYAQDKQDGLYRGDIHHTPWSLQQAKAEIETNTVAPFPLPDIEPRLHYGRRIEVLVWGLQKLD
jgi:uncharacterized protein YqjF (DUF2071 family)